MLKDILNDESCSYLVFEWVINDHVVNALSYQRKG